MSMPGRPDVLVSSGERKITGMAPTDTITRQLQDHTQRCSHDTKDSS